MEFGSQNFTQNKGTETDKTKRRKTDKETPLMRFRGRMSLPLWESIWSITQPRRPIYSSGRPRGEQVPNLLLLFQQVN